jgi:thiamine-monophosphate kinase
MARDREVLAALLGGLGPWGGLRATSGHPAPLPRGSIAAGDDAAVLPASMLRDGSIVLACDGLEEDVHFREGWFSLEDLAWKALAVSLSDLAAMAAEPVAFLLALSWPEHRRIEEARKLGTALATTARRFECPLVGGDVDVTNGPLRLSVTTLGSCRTPLLRSGGQAGDRLFVTGPLGGAAFAVSALLAGAALDDQHEPGASALRALRRPMPRLDVARALQGRAHAAIDLSDGLLDDTRHLASASGLAAFVHLPSIPRHPAVTPSRARELALEGGEDYELLLAGPPDLGRLPSLTEVGALLEGDPGHVDVRT